MKPKSWSALQSEAFKVKVLVTGSGGQLGQDTVAALKKAGTHAIGTNRKEMDVADFSKVEETVSALKPQAVVHCAALTDTVLCEQNVELAYRVNVLGTRNVAVACEKNNAAMLYISTDYVFDGKKQEPYLEYDATAPLNRYGETKLAGESLVRSLVRRFFVVRSSWLYGRHGKSNFVKSMLEQAQKKKEIRVVHDQFGSPTYTGDLALQIVRLISTESYGIYHAANHGVCSWYEFAQKIFKSAGINGLKVVPISTEESHPKLRRPKYSVLRNLCLELEGLEVMRNVDTALRDYLK